MHDQKDLAQLTAAQLRAKWRKAHKGQIMPQGLGRDLAPLFGGIRNAYTAACRVQPSANLSALRANLKKQATSNRNGV